MTNTYFPNETWQALAEALTGAATHPVDPESAIKMALAEYGVMPEMCREDCEVMEAV